MFDLIKAKMSNMLISSRILGKIMRRDLETIEGIENDLKQLDELQAQGIKQGNVSIVQDSTKKIIKDLVLYFKKDFEIEKKDQVYLARIIDDLKEKTKLISKDIKIEDKVIFDDKIISSEAGKNLLKQYGFENKEEILTKTKETLEKIQKLIDDEFKEIDSKLLEFTRLSIDQKRENHKLRDTIIGLFKNYQAKVDARILKRIANEEKKVMDTVSEELKAFTKLGGNIDTLPKLKLYLKILDSLGKDGSKLQKMLVKIIKASSFVFRYAVFRYFRGIDRMLRIEETEKQLKQEGFPPGPLAELEKRESSLSSYIKKKARTERRIASQEKRAA